MTRTRTGPRLALWAVVLAAGLAGCAQPADTPGVATADGASPSASASASADTDQAATALKFAQCMREHGVQMEDPVDGRITIKGDPGSQGTVEAAQKACRQYAPGGGEGGGPELSAADQQKFLAFAQCMREHGIPMEDPEFEGGGVRMKMGRGKGEAAPDRAKEEAAHQECAKQLPEEMQDGPGPGGGEPAEAGGTS